MHNTFGEIPPPLVGASVNVIRDKIYLFGGRLASSRKVTNFLYILDLSSLEWIRHIPPPDSDPPPDARYFHSANVYNENLILFGGMGYLDQSNDAVVMDSVAVLNTETMCWKKIKIQPSLYSPQPRYAHTSTVIGDSLLVFCGQNLDSNYLNEMNILNLKTWEWEAVKALEKHVGAYRSSAATVSQSKVYLYTNSNYPEVKRDLQLVQPNLTMDDLSESMTGDMPPSLRFPTTNVLEQHMILSGIYLVPGVQAYEIWSLDLKKMYWSRLDTGNVFQSGSWNRALLYKNQYLVLGNPYRNLLEDYSHRHNIFDHLAVVNLEAFGIYEIPQSTCSSLAQEMGLRLLNEPAVSDFYIITHDHQKIPVNSSVLCQRWPYFKKLIQDHSSNHVLFPYPHSVVSALLQFIYTDHLLTAQQYQPPILSQLLILSDMYHLPRLASLATHALHQMLTMSTAPLIFETAALSHQTNLQVRALNMMIAAKKIIEQPQRQPQQPRSHSIPSNQDSSLLRKQSNASSETSESLNDKKTRKEKKKKGILRGIW